MHERSLPVLALDVDGTVLPYLPNTWPRPPAPNGFTEDRAWGFDVWVGVHLRAALPRLAESFDIVWVTDWEENANVEVSELVGLPVTLPFLPKPKIERRSWWKLDVLADYVGARDLAWADDQMRASARAWAHARPQATLLIKPDRWSGLSARHVQKLEVFARSRA